ncbi:hypothetical protein [Spongiimicrobium salis]|uniref:hypothetical protein n=1 Tax=Spongiimicrobium salis TaxID=1667022 RepID=UPI00374DF828
MKKIVLTLFFCALTLAAKSQKTPQASPHPAVEKSVFGIQTGYAGLWIHHELKLSRQLALRTELGLDAYENDDFFPDASFLLTTVITMEPRWYYNFDNRALAGKRIDGNSGNFFALKTSFRSDNLLIKFGKDSRAEIVDNLAIVPTWGIRRNVGKHFNYEAGIGVGYIHFFSKNSGFPKDRGEATINLHLRIGYQF